MPLSLGGTCFWIYLDNNNRLEAIVRGGSNTGIIAILVARFWHMVHRFDICAWFSRVRSDLNPADLPTRGEKLPFCPRFRAGFSPFIPLPNRCRAAIAALSDPLEPAIRG